MPIRLQLLLFGVIGNVLVAAIFIFSFGYRENIQEDSSNESLLTLYESAWYQTYNKSFDVMSKWLPVTGENASFWDPDSEIFLDEVASSNIYTGSIRDPFAVDCQPKGIFERASLKASEKFKYKPRVVDGEAIEVAGVQNKFTYELEN